MEPPGDGEAEWADAGEQPLDASAASGSESPATAGRGAHAATIGAPRAGPPEAVDPNRTNIRTLQRENAALIDGLRALNEQVKRLEAGRGQPPGSGPPPSTNPAPLTDRAMGKDRAKVAGVLLQESSPGGTTWQRPLWTRPDGSGLQLHVDHKMSWSGRERQAVDKSPEDSGARVSGPEFSSLAWLRTTSEGAREDVRFESSEASTPTDLISDRVLSRLVTFKVFILMQRYTLLRTTRRRAVLQQQQSWASRRCRAAVVRWRNRWFQAREARCARNEHEKWSKFTKVRCAKSEYLLQVHSFWVLWRLQVQDSKVEKNMSNPVAVALALDCTFDAVMTSFGMVQRLSTQIRHDVSEALSISPDKVAVLCYQKGSVIAEVAIMPQDIAVTPSLLVQRLIEQAGDPNSRLRTSETGALLISAQSHGPIGVPVCSAVSNAVESLEEQRDFLAEGLNQAFETIAILKEEKEKLILIDDIKTDSAKRRLGQFLFTVSEQRRRTWFAGVFTGWACESAYARPKNRLAYCRAKLCEHFRRKHLGVCFKAFRHGLQLNRRQTLKCCLLSYMRSRSLQRRAFDGFHGFKVRMLTAERYCRLAFVRISKPLQSEIFDQWYFGALAERHHRLDAANHRVKQDLMIAIKVGQERARLNQKLLQTKFQTFWSWHNVLKKAWVKARSNKIVEIATRRWVQTGMYRVWSRWRDWCRQLRIARRVVHRWKKPWRRRAFLSWYDEVRRENIRKKCQTRLMLRWNQHLLWRAWLPWLDLHVQTRRVLKVKSKFMHTELWKCWNAWVHQVRMMSMTLTLATRWINLASHWAFETWRESVVISRRKRHMGRMAVSKWSKRLLCSVWNLWKSTVQALILLQRKKQKVICKWTSGRVCQALAAWMEHMRKVWVVRKAAQRFLLSVVSSALCRWCEYVQKGESMRAKSIKVVTRMVNMRLVSAFYGWQEKTVESKRLKMKALKTVKRLAHRSIALAFECWRYLPTKQKQLRQRTLVVVQRMVNVCMVMTFEVWRDNSAAASQRRAVQKRQDRVQDKTVRRLLNRTVSNAWLCWCQWLEAIVSERDEEDRRRQTMARVVRRLRNGALASSFGLWVSKNAEAKHNRHVMRKIVLRMSHTVLSTAMELWMLVTGTVVAARKERERQERIMAKVICRHKNRSMWAAYELWADNVSEMTRSREIMKRVVLRMCHRGLSRALDLWTHGVELQRGERATEERRRRAMSKVLRRMQHTRASAVVSRWRESVHEKKIIIATTSRVLVRWNNKALVMGLDAWRGHTVNEARKRALMNRIMKRLQQRGASLAWSTWVGRVEASKAEVAEEERREHVQDKTVRRLLNRTVSNAWLCWCQWLEAIVSERDEEDRRRQTMARVVRRLRNGALASSFGLWVSKNAEAKHNRHVMRKIVLRMSKRLLSIRFQTWSMYSTSSIAYRRYACAHWISRIDSMLSERDEEDRRRQTMARVVRRLRNGALASSFGLWVSKNAEAKHNRHVMRKIVLRMSHKVLSTAMELWMLVTGTVVAARKERERQERIIAKVICRHKNRSMWAAYELWADNVSEMTRSREIMKRVVLRMCHRGLSRALDLWTHGVELQRGERATEERRRRAMSKVLRRMQHTRASAVVSRWRESVHEKKIIIATTSRVLVRWNNKALVMGLDAWRGHTVNEARKRALMNRIMKRLQQRGASLAWSTWVGRVEASKAEVAEEERREHVQDKTVRRLLNRTVSNAWLCWCQWLEAIVSERDEEDRRRQTMARVVRRLRNGALASSFGLWVSKNAEAKHIRHVMRKIVLRMSKRLLSIRFQTWSMYSTSSIAYRRYACAHWISRIDSMLSERDEEDRRRQTMARVVRRLRNGALASSFGLWVSKNAEAKHNRHVMRKIVLRMSHKVLSTAMELWMLVTGTVVAARKERERQERIIAKVICRHKNRSMWAAYELWADNVSEMTRSREIMKRVVLRMCHRGLSRALDLWTHGVELQRGERATEERRRRAMSKVLRRMQHTRASAVVSRWRESVHEKKIIIATTSRVLVRWNNKALVMGLDAWRGHTVNEARKRALMNRIMKRLQQRGASLAWSTWVGRVEASKAEVAEEERREHVQDKTVRRLLNRTVSNAWLCWCQWLEAIVSERDEEDRRRQTMARVVRRLRNGALASSFGLWVSKNAEAKHNRHVMRKIVLRMSKRLLSVVLCCWKVGLCVHSRASMLMHLLRKLIRPSFEHSCIGSAMMSLLKRPGDFVLGREFIRDIQQGFFELTHRTTKLMAFRKWRKWSHEHRKTKRSALDVWTTWVKEHQRRRTMDRVVVDINRKKVLRAFFHTWLCAVRRGQNFVRIERLLRADDNGQDSLIEGVICGWKKICRIKRKRKLTLANFNGNLFWRGFLTWRDNVQTQSRLIRASSKVIKRMRCISCLKALACWEEHCSHLQTVKRKRQQALKRWMKAQAWRCWRRWEEQMYIAQVLRFMKARWGNLNVKRSFDRWIVHVDKIRRLNHCIRRSLIHLSSAMLCRAWAKWHNHSSLLIRARRLMIRSLHRTCSYTLQVWTQAHTTSRSTSNSVSKAIRGWLRRELRAALQSWLEHVQDIKRLQKTVRRALKRWSLDKLWKSWSCWKHRVRIERISGGILKRWQDQDRSRALSQWMQHHAERRKLHLSCTTVVLRIINSIYWRVFVHWEGAMRDSKRTEGITRRAVRKWTSSTMFQSLSRWQDTTRLVRSVRSMVCRWKKCHMIRALGRWIEYGYETRRLQHFMKRAMCRWNHGFLWKGWETWRLRTSQMKSFRAILRQWSNVFRAKVLRIWTAYTGRSSKVMKYCCDSLSRWSKSSLLCSFVKWQDFMRWKKATKILLICVRSSSLQTAFDQLLKRAKYKSQLGFVVRIHSRSVLRRVFKIWKSRRGRLELANKVAKGLCKGVAWGGVTILRLAFNALVFAVFAEKRSQRLRRRIADKRHWYLSARFFCNWSDAVHMSHFAFVHKAHSAAQQEIIDQRRHYENKLDACMKRLMDANRDHRFLEAERGALCDYADSMRHKIVSKIRTRSLLDTISTAWQAWRQSVYLQGVGERAIIRMLCNVQASALKGWMQHTAQVQRLREHATQMILRLKNSHMFLAVQAWQAYVFASQTTRNLAFKTVQRMLNRTISNAWISWCANASEARMLRGCLSKVVIRLRIRLAAEALDRWMAHADQRRQMLETARRTILRMQNIVCARALQIWRHHLSEEARLKSCLHKVAHHWSHRGTVMVMARWHEHMEEASRLRQTAKIVLARWSMRAVSMAWNVWEGTLQQKKILRNVIRRIQMVASAMAVATWRQRATDQIKMRITLGRLILRMQNIVCARALQIWRHHLSEEARLKSCLHKVAHHWSHRGTVMVMARWHEHMEEASRLRQTAKIVLARWSMRAVSMAWNVWEGTLQQKKILRNVIRRIQMVASAMAVATWRQRATDQIKMRITLGRLILRMQNIVCARALQIWRHHLSEEARLKSCLHKVAHHWSHRGTVMVMARWHEHMEEASRLRQTAKIVLARWSMRAVSMAWNVWEGTLQQKKILRNVIRRIQMVASAMAVATWRQRATDQIKMRITLGRLILRMQNIVCARALQIWRHHLSEEARLKSCLHKVAHHWSHRGTVMVMARWHEHMEEASRLRQTAKIVLARWSMRLLALGWVSWRYRLCLKKAAQKIITRWASLNLFNAWDAFCDGISYQAQCEWNATNGTVVSVTVDVADTYLKESFMSTLPRCRQISEGLSHDMSKALSAPTDCFQLLLQDQANEELSFVFAFTAHGNEKSQKMAQSLISQIHHEDSKLRIQTFGKYIRNGSVHGPMSLDLQDLLVAQNEKYVLAQENSCRARNRQADSLLVTNLVANTLLVTKVFMRFARVVHYQKTKTKKLRKIRLVLGKWTKEALVLSFAAWSSRTTETGKIRRAAAKTVRRWRGIEMVAALSAWCERVIHRKNLRKKFRKVLGHWSNKLVVKAFASWSNNIWECQRRCQTMHRVLQRWNHRSFGLVWSAWCGRVIEGRKLRRCLQAMKQHSAFAAFKRWIEAAFESRTARKVAIKVVLRWNHIAYSRAVRSWQVHVAEKRRIVAVTQRVLRRWTGRTLSRAVGSWLGHTLQVKSLRLILTRIRKGGLGKALHCWKESNLLQRQAVNTINKVARQWINRTLFVMFVRWRHHAADVKQRANFARQILLKWLNSRGSQAIRRWRETTEHLKRARQIANKVVKRIKHHELSKSLSRWRESVHLHLGMIESASKIVMRLKNHLKWISLSRWQIATRQQIRHKNNTAKVVLRLLNHALFVSLARWKEAKHESTRLKGLASRVVMRWTSCLIFRVFNTWYSSVLDKRKVAKALTRWHQLSLWKAMAGWRRYHDIISLASGIVLRLKNHTAWVTFAQWRERAHESKTRHLSLKRAISRWTQTKLACSVAAWAIGVEESRRLQKISVRVMTYWTHRDLTMALTSWQHLFKVTSTANKMIVRRWARWLSLWFRRAEHSILWRDAKSRAVEVGQINRVRTLFRSFARCIHIARQHRQYVVWVDQIQAAANKQLAAMQEEHQMSSYKLEEKCNRTVLQARVERLLLSRTVINRMLHIQKAVLLDNFALGTALLKTGMTDANLHADRICERKSLALRLRYLQRWVIEVQACRIDALEDASRESEVRVKQLEADKQMLHKLVEEALAEQQQLAAEYRTMQQELGKKKAMAKTRHSHRSESPTGRRPSRSRNPPWDSSVRVQYP